MKICRENYEIWFTDWLDNNLTSRQTDELYAFLEQNVDLRDEFNDLAGIKLEPEKILYPGKDMLRKSSSEIDLTQFDLLCAAMVEKDLSSVQEREMQEIISSDEERKKTSEIFGMLKLHPPGEVYSGKNKLLRKTAGQKIFRLAAIGLSAAATIAFIVTIGFLRPSLTSPSFQGIGMISDEMTPSGIQQNPGSEPVNSTPVDSAENVPPAIEEPVAEEKELQAEPDAPELIMERETVPQKVALNVSSSLTRGEESNSLIASSVSFVAEEVQIDDDNRSNVGRFLAQTFRTKVLDEASDEPVKGYEIAEVGINGINKLLGWDMALSRNSDENGEIKSVYFSSRMLKFNAPVKNTDIAE